MSCERYWRDGVVLVERGLPDPHRDSCADCTAAHHARLELVRALPLIGAGATGDPSWQARVWRQIERAERPARLPPWRRWVWALEAALLSTCAILLWLGMRVRAPAVVAPTLEPILPKVAMRNRSWTIDHGVRVTIGAGDEVRIYRGGNLMLWCSAETPQPGCRIEADRVVAEIARFGIPDQYHVVVTSAKLVRWTGRLGGDLAAIKAARSEAKLKYQLSVR